MNWEAIGAIGEIIGAAAVVVSLIYLATQIRTQNNEARLAATHEILVGFRESLRVFTSGNTADLFAKANNDFDSLSDGEAIKLISATLQMLRLWEEAYIQNEQGHLEDRVWDGINSQYSSYLSYPALDRTWEIRGKHFDLKFQNLVNNVDRSEIKFR